MAFKLFYRKRKATPTLRLKNCCGTSILKKIKGLILLHPASCIAPVLLLITVIKNWAEYRPWD